MYHKNTAVLHATEQFKMFHRMETHMHETGPSRDLGDDLNLVGIWTLKRAPFGIAVDQRTVVQAMTALSKEYPTVRSHLVVSEEGCVTVEFTPHEAVVPVILSPPGPHHFNVTRPGLKATLSCYTNPQGDQVFAFRGSHLIFDGRAAGDVLKRFAELRIKYAIQKCCFAALALTTVGSMAQLLPSLAPLIPGGLLVASGTLFPPQQASVDRLYAYSQAQAAILNHPDFQANLVSYCQLVPLRCFDTNMPGFKPSSGEPLYEYHSQVVTRPNGDMAAILASKAPQFVNGGGRSTLSDLMVGKYAFMAALAAVTGQPGITVREQRLIAPEYRHGLPPHYSSCAGFNSDPSDFSLTSIHAHMKRLREASLAGQTSLSGPHEMIPMEAYIAHLQAIEHRFSPHMVAEYNPVGRYGKPLSPLWEHHLASLVSRGLDRIGIHRGTQVEGEIHFGNWGSEDYGPAVSASGVITPEHGFELRISTRKDVTQPGLAQAIADATHTVLEKWAKNPDLKVSEMGIPRFGAQTVVA